MKGKQIRNVKRIDFTFPLIRYRKARLPNPLYILLRRPVLTCCPHEDHALSIRGLIRPDTSWALLLLPAFQHQILDTHSSEAVTAAASWDKWPHIADAQHNPPRVAEQVITDQIPAAVTSSAYRGIRAFSEEGRGGVDVSPSRAPAVLISRTSPQCKLERSSQLSSQWVLLKRAAGQPGLFSTVLTCPQRLGTVGVISKAWSLPSGKERRQYYRCTESCGDAALTIWGPGEYQVLLRRLILSWLRICLLVLLAWVVPLKLEPRADSWLSTLLTHTLTLFLWRTNHKEIFTESFFIHKLLLSFLA